MRTPTINIAFIHNSPAFKNRMDYVLGYIANHPLAGGRIRFLEGEEGCDKTIYYGDLSEKPEGSIGIPAQGILFRDKTPDISGFCPNIYTWEGGEINSVEVEKRPSSNLFREGNFQFDLLEMLFFHLSRYEEVFAGEEEWGPEGWKKEEGHFLVRYGLEKRPVVDEVITAFLEVAVGEKVRKRTTYEISHDLDILFRLRPWWKVFRALAGNMYYRRGAADFFKIVTYTGGMWFRGERDPYDNFEELLRKEGSWKGKQLFLMVGGNTKYDNKYNIEHPYIDKIIKLAEERGYQIGLHPSFNAGFEKEMYQEELGRLSGKLGRPVTLNRQHWLRFSWGVTPYLWEESGIEVDYSMGYNRHFGFRCGTGFAYHMYDFRREAPFSWKEQPMVMMESAGIHFAKSTKQDLGAVMAAFAKQNKMNTHYNINFHNSNFDPLLKTGRVISEFYHHQLIQIIES